MLTLPRILVVAVLLEAMRFGYQIAWDFYWFTNS